MSSESESGEVVFYPKLRFKSKTKNKLSKEFDEICKAPIEDVAHEVNFIIRFFIFFSKTVCFFKDGKNSRP